MDEDESESAFPGLSLRSSDAAAFLELLKSDKQRKEGGDPEAEEVRSKETKEPRSASSSPEASSPEVSLCGCRVVVFLVHDSGCLRS